MTRPPTHASSLLDRYLRQAEAAIRAREGVEERDADLEAILEVLAMTVALEVMGELVRVPPATRESLRRVGARALLQIGTLLSDDDEDRAEAVRLIGPYARDGIRALAGKEAPAPRRDDAIVLDAELVGLSRGQFDGFRLAEIAWRVRESSAAKRALGMLRRVEPERGDASGEPRLRLAADGGAPMRDPSSGRRIAELTVADHAIELHRFDDGAIAAYAASAVMLRLGGEHVTSRVSRAGYAEASLGESATRVELDVAGTTTTLEIS
ncbi:MAG: hypothetical protein J0L92_22830 [Deltaproteobacteria bacterium]|nr:hypothetical protein [Deltaproteobacteria bacterium]